MALGASGVTGSSIRAFESEPIGSKWMSSTREQRT